MNVAFFKAYAEEVILTALKKILVPPVVSAETHSTFTEPVLYVAPLKPFVLKVVAIEDAEIAETNGSVPIVATALTSPKAVAPAYK